MSAILYPRIEIIDIPGKGLGVVAREPISRGTRIIAEKPRIWIPHGQALNQRFLDTLSKEDLAFFLSFPAAGGDGADPIAARGRHSVPCVGGRDAGDGLFETVCRLGHTCHSPLGRPNAMFTWVEERREEIVMATEDISANEEITVTFIQPSNHVSDPAAFIRTHYGYDCACAGCQRPLAERLKSVERVKAFVRWRRELPHHIEGNTGWEPLDILDDIERNVLAICAEGYVLEIRGCAHDAFQLCGFHGDGESAAKWEVMSREIHRIEHGVDNESYKKSANLVRRPTSFYLWNSGEGRKLRGPSQEVVTCFKTAVWGSQSIQCANHACPKTQATNSSDTFQRCKPCIEKLGLDVYYCSRDCQVSDWKRGHKAICGQSVKV